MGDAGEELSAPRQLLQLALRRVPVQQKSDLVTGGQQGTDVIVPGHEIVRMAEEEGKDLVFRQMGEKRIESCALFRHADGEAELRALQRGDRR